MADRYQIPDEIIAEIKGRVARASDGPWVMHSDDMEVVVVQADGDRWPMACYPVASGMEQGESNGEDDGAFIANAREDIPMLLLEREVLLERIKVLEDLGNLQETIVQLATGSSHPVSVEEITESFKQMLRFAYESRENKATVMIEKIHEILGRSGEDALDEIKAIVEVPGE